MNVNELYNNSQVEEAVQLLKDSSENIVLIGANGSGKSTFSRYIIKKLGTSKRNVAIISAQKVFNFETINNLPIGKSYITAVQSFQDNDKLGRGSGSSSIGLIASDFQNIIYALFEDFNKKARETYRKLKSNELIERKASVMERVFTIWEGVFTHIKLEYDNNNIKVLPIDGGHYFITELSDGEKAVFYYVSHVLLAKENSYIIIDEPENHLNLAIVNKLWDILEKERNDCQFVYLTHNIDFASSRISAMKIWVRKYIHPTNWKFERLLDNDEIPERLLMEILGSKENILFCEGDKSSLDYKLYSILFPKFCVSPVGGYQNVISFTRACNKNKTLYRKIALGIIDGDYHLDEEKKSWERDLIFCLNVSEIENLLCDEKLLSVAQEQFLAENNSVNKSKEKLFEKLGTDKQKQTLKYVRSRVNHLIEKNLFTEKNNSLDGLLDELESKIKFLIPDSIRKWYNEREALISNIIRNRDYEKALVHYNFKGMLSFVTQDIIKDYKDKIIKLIEKQSELQAYLKNKYFGSVVERMSTTKNGDSIA